MRNPHNRAPLMYALVPLVLLALAACAPTAAPAPAQPTAQTTTAQPTAPAVSVAQPTSAAEATSAPTQPTTAAMSTSAADCNITPPSSPIEVTFLGWPGWDTDTYVKWLESCNAVKNVKVNIRQMDNSSAIEQMSLAFASGGASPWAIVHQANSSIQRNGWKGWLMPLNDLIDKYKAKYQLDDIAPAQWDAATFDGKILGIPMQANTIIIMYRSDLFEKHNLKVPTTYDEIITACKALKDEPGITVPFTIDLSAGWAWSIAFFEAIRSEGGDLFAQGSNAPAFNSPEGVKALTKLKEVADNCMGAEGLTMGYEQSEAALRNGQVAFIHTWADSGAAMVDPAKSKFANVIKFAPAASVEPGGKLAGSAWNDYWSIPASYKGDTDTVFQMIMEAGRPDHQQVAAKTGLVTRSSVMNSGTGVPYAAAALETITKGAGPVPKNLPYGLLDAALGNYLPLVGTGELTPQEALQKAEAEYIAQAKAQGFLK